LIVDDNEPARRVLLSHLFDWFKRVEIAENGHQALALMKKAEEEKDPFGLVFVDLHIPGMDGWQFASEVKNAKVVGATPLILLSPMGWGTEAKMKLLGWFAGYINKPVKRLELLETVFAVVSGTETGDPDKKTTADGTKDAARNRNKHILVAEDHLVNQQLFCTILEKMGYTVSLANNGLEAVRLAQNERVDLVFMDVQMPEMNGYEASQKIRELGIDTPIVAVTANALKGEKEKCLSVGMNDYLTKPFKSRDLLPFLEKYLSVEDAEPVEEFTETTAETDPAIFDFLSAQDSFMGKKEIVVRVVKAFQKKVEAQLLSMKASLDSGNWTSLDIESHGIKGGAWNLQARRLGNAAALLEAAAKEKDAQSAETHIEEVRREFEIFRDAVGLLPDFRES
jgi:CheY-like chemotaxis protein